MIRKSTHEFVNLKSSVGVVITHGVDGVIKTKSLYPTQSVSL